MGLGCSLGKAEGKEVKLTCQKGEDSGLRPSPYLL